LQRFGTFFTFFEDEIFLTSAMSFIPRQYSWELYYDYISSYADKE